MKNCTTCKHAEWHRSLSGRVHRSGTGICVAPTPLDDRSLWPASISPGVWHAMRAKTGGPISRLNPYEECSKWQKK